MISGAFRYFSYIFFVVFFFVGCAKRTTKDINDMSFDDLKGKAMTALDVKKNENAIKYLEYLVTQHPDHQDIFEYKFILADLYLKSGKLEAAYRLYKNYIKMYPSEKKTELAYYNSILAKYYQTLKVSKDCDEEDTTKAMRLCKSYLNNSQHKKYRGEVTDIQYTCERRLIDKEVYVFNTYLLRNKLQSAQCRLDHLRGTYVSKHPALEAQLLYLEGKLAQKQKNDDLVQKKAEKLFAMHPDSEYAKKAQGLVRKRKLLF